MWLSTYSSREVKKGRKMTEQEAIKDLKFIRDAYRNLSENGADRYRAVGKGNARNNFKRLFCA